MLQIEFVEAAGYVPHLVLGDERLVLRDPVNASYLAGGAVHLNYASVAQTAAGEWLAQAAWRRAGYAFTLEDRWSGAADRAVLRRLIRAEADGPAGAADGVQFRLQAAVARSAHREWRFCAPATHYSDPVKPDGIREARVFMDDRLTYPLVTGYAPADKRYLTLARLSLPAKTQPPQRTEALESRYLQRTEVGSVGYAAADDGTDVALQAYWPYYEGDRSVALNAARTPVSAFYPLDGSSFAMELSYEFRIGEGATYADAVYGAFTTYAGLFPPAPAELPFTLEDSIDYRNVSLRRSYRELDNGGAGFFFHFDPRHGYQSQPSGFGTSFNNIPHESYTRILEYGFTGRQLNAAYTLAKADGGEWIGKGRKVAQFFVDRLAAPSGFLYSLFDIPNDKPFASFGEAGAPKLHYISHGTIPGNYLRTMVEPAFDLLLMYQLYESLGMKEEAWLRTTERFARFLLSVQNADGSWYRAYEPDGTPLKNAEGFGNDEFSSKSASCIPILYLIAMGKAAGGNGAPFLEAARRAADYVLGAYVPLDYYMGGTLDNPNVIDKEAAQYTMAALYGLYKLTDERRYLEGAVRAAKIFVTWNYIWNAPHFPGTELDRVGFRTVGTGGINSIWGGGVVDIYSLFHIEELDRLGAAAGESFFREMAEWIAVGTQQLLSHPGDLMGFADVGMQPEGFGICNQGKDEGMIGKGDIWGTLGWIYSAGIYGLGKYLEGGKR